MTRRVPRTASGVRTYFRRRFGVADATWDPYRFSIGGSSVFVRGPDSPIELGWKEEQAGLRVATTTTDAFKPSTRGVQWLGARLRRNRIPLGNRALKALLDRDTPRSVDLGRVSDRGYVAVFFRGYALGCCFWTGERLRTQLPKGLTGHFPEQIIDS